MGDGDGLGRGIHGVTACGVADVGDVDQHAGVVERGDHPVAGTGQAAVSGLPTAGPEMVGDVVGHLDDPDTDVGEDPRHLRVITQHGAVLEAQDNRQYVVGHRQMDLINGPDDSDHVGVVPTEVPEGADPGHGSGEVLPYPDRGVHHVDPTGPHLGDHLA